MSMCRVIPCVVGRGWLLCPVCCLGKTLLAFALLHFFTLSLNLPATWGISWLPIFAFLSLLMKKTFNFLVLVLEGLVGLHRTIQLQLLWHYWLKYKWFALETDWGHSVIFEIAPKYCIWGGFCQVSVGKEPTPVFLPRESHGERKLEGHSP